ncbi:hypothetical protein [Ramlibacter sp. PS4R-6]|uniref:hypothetical protein n=1 Tax=Ramlibacter sp. PS4R-6 TaxID=3133438 RepID=UPI00309C550B
MKRLVYLALPLLVVACGDQPQTIGSNSKVDKQAFEGTGVAPPYTAAGWKNGDKGAWEQQLKVRTQMGQNDYNKVP